MGMFLSLSAVWGKTKDEVVYCLNNYAITKGGGLEPAEMDGHHQHYCIIEETHGHTTIVYPTGYFLWDETSAYLSKALGTPVFFFHIHDSDLWMYELFVNGEIVDQFNPIPHYWDDHMSEEERQSWKGDVNMIAEHIPGVEITAIANYLVCWNVELRNPPKAYIDDEFVIGDEWQLTDFMRKLGFAYALNDAGVPSGDWHKIYTNKFTPAIPAKVPVAAAVVAPPKKPWWKFW